LTPSLTELDAMSKACSCHCTQEILQTKNPRRLGDNEGFPIQAKI
jgi:hypothetical protein